MKETRVTTTAATAVRRGTQSRLWRWPIEPPWLSCASVVGIFPPAVGVSCLSCRGCATTRLSGPLRRGRLREGKLRRRTFFPYGIVCTSSDYRVPIASVLARELLGFARDSTESDTRPDDEWRAAEARGFP